MDIRVLFDFDELNRVFAKTQQSKYDMQKMLEASYILGLQYAFEQLNGREPYEDEIDELLDIQMMDEVVWNEIDGKNFSNRMDEIEASEGTNENETTDTSTAHKNYGMNVNSRIRRILETEYHRIFDTASYQTAQKIERQSGRSIVKIWESQKDNRVRETHDYLDGQEQPLGDDFYTYNGDHAPCPGKFGIADEDVNCRCYLSFKYADE